MPECSKLAEIGNVVGLFRVEGWNRMSSILSLTVSFEIWDSLTSAALPTVMFSIFNTVGFTSASPVICGLPYFQSGEQLRAMLWGSVCWWVQSRERVVSGSLHLQFGERCVPRFSILNLKIQQWVDRLFHIASLVDGKSCRCQKRVASCCALPQSLQDQRKALCSCWASVNVLFSRLFCFTGVFMYLSFIELSVLITPLFSHGVNSPLVKHKTQT